MYSQPSGHAQLVKVYFHKFSKEALFFILFWINHWMWSLSRSALVSSSWEMGDSRLLILSNLSRIFCWRAFELEYKINRTFIMNQNAKEESKWDGHNSYTQRCNVTGINSGVYCFLVLHPWFRPGLLRNLYEMSWRVPLHPLVKSCA